MPGFLPSRRLFQGLAIVLFLFLGAPVASADLIDLSTMNLVGTAQMVSGNVLRLTPNFDTNTDGSGNPIGDPPAGAAWTPLRYDVVDPFTVSFAFRMSDPTGHLDNDGSAGDGIAFLIQNDPRGINSIGRGAGGLGFLGIYDSVAVMFDTYQNNYTYGDPNGNYVAVNTRGTDFNVPHHFCTNGQLTTDPSQPLDLPGVTCTSNPALGMTGSLSPLLDDGAVHNVTVAYHPGTMAVIMDGGLILTVPLDLSSTLSLQDGTAFLGFTAGTRFSYQNQDILNTSFTGGPPVPEPSSLALILTCIGLVLALHLRKKPRLQ